MPNELEPGTIASPNPGEPAPITEAPQVVLVAAPEFVPPEPPEAPLIPIAAAGAVATEQRFNSETGRIEYFDVTGAQILRS